MAAIKLKGKRVTIYDIAKAVGIAPSSVSKALNDLPSVRDHIKALVKATAKELNYKHNSSAANLRRGSSRIIGVIVPKINVAFFSDAIAGIEEACYDNNHRLIICQSDESYEKEVQAVETLLQQNVDCIIISLSQETKSTGHLREINDHHVHLVQFDRVDYSIESHTIVNDNKDAAYKAVKHLVDQGYRKIALLGGPDHLPVYRDRKEGYLKAIREAGFTIPYDYILDNSLRTDTAMKSTLELLQHKKPPDAFFTVTDYAALGVLKAAVSVGLHVPAQVGIIGFANEIFTDVITPSISTVDQKSRQLGKAAANIYFNKILSTPANKRSQKFETQVIESSIIIRESSTKKKQRKKTATGKYNVQHREIVKTGEAWDSR